MIVDVGITIYALDFSRVFFLRFMITAMYRLFLRQGKASGF